MLRWPTLRSLFLNRFNKRGSTLDALSSKGPHCALYTACWHCWHRPVPFKSCFYSEGLKITYSVINSFNPFPSIYSDIWFSDRYHCYPTGQYIQKSLDYRLWLWHTWQLWQPKNRATGMKERKQIQYFLCATQHTRDLRFFFLSLFFFFNDWVFRNTQNPFNLSNLIKYRDTLKQYALLVWLEGQFITVYMIIVHTLNK